MVKCFLTFSHRQASTNIAFSQNNTVISNSMKNNTIIGLDLFKNYKIQIIWRWIILKSQILCLSQPHQLAIYSRPIKLKQKKWRKGKLAIMKEFFEYWNCWFAIETWEIGQIEWNVGKRVYRMSCRNGEETGHLNYH